MKLLLQVDEKFIYYTALNLFFFSGTKQDINKHKHNKTTTRLSVIVISCFKVEERCTGKDTSVYSFSLNTP